MLNAILNTLKSNLETLLKEVPSGDSLKKPLPVDQPKVAFVKLQKGSDTLVENAINLALFATKESKGITGTPSFLATVDREQGQLNHPPMRLELTVLLIFNLNLYLNALNLYEQVLAYLHQNNSLQASFNGSNQQIEIELVSIDEHNDIRLRESYQIPATPILLYSLRYALIQSVSTMLPRVKKVEAKSGTISSGSQSSAWLANLVVDPVANELSKATSNFRQLIYLAQNHWNQGQPDPVLTACDRTRNSLSQVITATQVVIDKVKEATEKGQPIEQADQYLFALDNVVAGTGPIQTAMKDTCALLSGPGADQQEFLEKVEEQENALMAQQVRFANQVYEMSFCLDILNQVFNALNDFNALGLTLYTDKARGGPFEQNRHLSTVQVREKRLGLPLTAADFKSSYTTAIGKFEKEPPEAHQPTPESLNPLIDKLNGFALALTAPIDEWDKLNEATYPPQAPRSLIRRRSAIDPVHEYAEVYQVLWRAANHPEGGPINEEPTTQALLLEALQQCFNEK